MKEKSAPRRVTKAEREQTTAPVAATTPDSTPPAAETIIQLNLELIDPNLNQPRKFFDEAKIARLADAINAAIKNGEEVWLLPNGNQDGAWRVVKAGATLARLELWVVGEQRGSKHVVTPEDILTTFAQPGAVNAAKKL